MNREEIKKWLLDKTTSIEATDIEKQSMLGEDIIDLMGDIIKENNKTLLCDFFKYFRDNGEKHIGMTIEQFVDEYLRG